jgi:hypothetical protein
MRLLCDGLAANKLEKGGVEMGKKRLLFGKILMAVGLCILLAGITGCAEFQGTAKGPEKPEQVDPRAEAVRKYNYSGPKDALFVETMTITPVTVTSGGTVTVAIPFTVLSSYKDKKFLVQEVFVLSGQDISLELSRKKSEREQGTNTLTMQFVIPKGLSRGNYTLANILTTNGMEKKQSVGFRVK